MFPEISSSVITLLSDIIKLLRSLEAKLTLRRFLSEDKSNVPESLLLERLIVVRASDLGSIIVLIPQLMQLRSFRFEFACKSNRPPFLDKLIVQELSLWRQRDSKFK